MKHAIYKSSFIKVGIFLYARYAAPGITTRARNSIRHHSLAPRNIYIPPRRSTHTRLVSESEVNILVSEKPHKHLPVSCTSGQGGVSSIWYQWARGSFSRHWGTTSFITYLKQKVNKLSIISVQGSARPTFVFRDRVQDWNFHSLNFETRSVTQIFWVSVLRPSRDWSFQSLNFETESETQIFWVSISRPGPRLKFSESQFRDRVRDCKFQSLNFETESETQFFQVSVSRPSPRL